MNYRKYATMVKEWSLEVLASLSCVLNAVTGGSHRHTFSARTGYEVYQKENRKWIPVKVVIDSIFYVLARQDSHCWHEYVDEEETPFK